MKGILSQPTSDQTGRVDPGIVLSVGDDDHGIWPRIRWHPPPLVTPRHDDTLSWWHRDQWQLTPRTRDMPGRARDRLRGGECKFCCVVEYLSRPMTRGIPFTSSNYLQRFQTAEEGQSSSGVMLSVQKPKSGASSHVSRGQQWLSAHRGSPDTETD